MFAQEIELDSSRLLTNEVKQVARCSKFKWHFEIKLFEIFTTSSKKIGIEDKE